MIVVVDTNVLIGEVLRVSGRRMLEHPRLVLFQAEVTAEETMHELGRRLDRLAVASTIPHDSMMAYRRDLPAFVRQVVHIARRPAYAARELEARERIPTDPDDWPAVALGLVLGAALLTLDRDFFGCGLPVWRPDTLRAYLRRLDAEPQ